MKKIILAISLFAAVSFSANAQSDGFFTSSYMYEGNREGTGSNPDWNMFDMPSIIGHGYEYDQNADPAPIGSGLLLLGGMALAYGMRKKKEN